MIVVASENAGVGIEQAMQVLKNRGSAVDAVEAGLRLVEANRDDHTVGLGGYPNILGKVELDAGIMDGRTLKAGAVAALKGYLHPISVARQVMDKLPHLFLAGDGAERFAAEIEGERAELLTEEVRQQWRARLASHLPDDILDGFEKRSDIWRWVTFARDPERAGGTVNMIAIDAEGNICSGVSTSGWAWKYPGRVGDSPIIGAGLYAHNSYGAVTCTGMGEMAIRAGTARSAVLYIKMGYSLAEAGIEAMNELKMQKDGATGKINIILVDAKENHTAFSNVENVRYIVLDPDMDQFCTLPRTCVPF
ncbi:MAG: N(4)-(beta-N-acetylglucosaminyl)-L-asparaginase [Anaerolineales bacterium]|nr:N(4)-(beta-N-acetylglucosaminyl)-L-asparaginase [Anaerolineales bacterium]